MAGPEDRLTAREREDFQFDVDAFRDGAIDEDELCGKLTHEYGFSPEEAEEFLRVERDDD